MGYVKVVDRFGNERDINPNRDKLMSEWNEEQAAEYEPWFLYGDRWRGEDNKRKVRTKLF